MADITTTLTTCFPLYPPHTIQRLSEMVLSPREHYRNLPAYLHALDRVVHVTSGANIYPLPPAVPDMSAIAVGPLSHVNGGASDSSVSTAFSVGSDEALGGALLTPIPWLQRRATSTEPDTEDVSHADADAGTGQTAAVPGQSQPQAQQNGRRLEGQVHTESTETIEGPNGVGSIETVSISVNGIPSHGHGALLQRAVTQGELLRQEQRAGVVPASQLARSAASADATGAEIAESTEGTGADASEEEIPHARGPEEIGTADTGPQTSSRPFIIGASGAVELQGIDIEAAVGRRVDHNSSSVGDGPPRPSTPKREAEEELDSDVPSKKPREDSVGHSEKSGDENGTGEGAQKTDEEGDIVLADESKAESSDGDFALPPSDTVVAAEDEKTEAGD